MRPLVLLAVSVGCAPLLPTEDPVQRALVRDVARVVDTRTQTGWLVDDLEVRAVLSDALDSACRVAPQSRSASLAWLDARIDDAGGDPARLWREADEDLGAVDDLLLLRRTRQVLREADTWARDGKCPFWLEPEPEFRGLQGFAGAWLLAAETGGRFYVQWDAGKPGFGGGGGARLLFGRGLSDRTTLIGGLEVGGAGRFTDIRFGERVEVPEVVLVAAVPLAVRRHGLSDHFEVELGPMGYVNQLRGEVQLGGRVGVGYGVSRLTLRGLLPGVTFAVNYDFVPAANGFASVHQIGAGLRAGVALPFR